MKHTMKKFSRGGAQGMYDRRMADIEKDRKIALAKGKNADVVEAKAAQRKADAEDDRAKRMGLDRTKTREAERTAESNLTKTRKYGAPKAVTKDELIAPGKMAESIGPITAPKSGLATAAKTPVKTPAKTPAKVEDKAPAKVKRTYYVSPENRAAIDAAAAKEPFTKTDTKALADLKTMQAKRNADSAARLVAARKVRGGSNFGADTSSKNASAALLAPKGSTSRSGSLFGGLFTTSDAFKKAQEAKGYGKAKGGKLMKKYAKGGSTPPQPTPADRARSKKRLDELKKLKPTDAEGKVVGSANRSEGRGYAHGGVTKEMPSSNQMGSMNMAKGGKTKMKPAAKGKGKGNPFAATKFGAAMMKKSADTEGRAMKKFAKGGSIDGCAVKGKTKGRMMAMGGMTGYKKGGKSC